MLNQIETPQGKTLYLIGSMISHYAGDVEHVYAEQVGADIEQDAGFYYGFDSNGIRSMFSRCDWKFKAVS